MENDIKKTSSRKKFIFLGLGTVAFFSVFKFFKKEKKKKTVKMLTQDGKLVEIDPDLIKSEKKKITNSELQSWIKNKSAKE